MQMPALTAAGARASPGEIHELREELNQAKMEKKKEAVKKVIAAMTVGKDVSMLFTDVVNCIQTTNIELKKARAVGVADGRAGWGGEGAGPGVVVATRGARGSNQRRRQG